MPWIGNLKKYGLDTKGNILQNKKLGNAVIATCCDVDGNCNYTSSDISCTGASGDVYKDMIKDTSTSSWAVSGDGNNVQRGAAGRIVRDQALANARTVFTSKYTSTSLINIKTLTKEDLGVTTDLEKDEILSYVTGLSVGSVSNTDTNKLRLWYMGDIIHSRPVIMEDGVNNVIFVGDNSGQLHCFVDDTSRADSTDALSEKWSFVPGEYWTKLSMIKNDRYPLYFVDGSPVIHDVGTERLLTFGFRRGGGSYVTLKIGTVDGNGNYSSDGYLTPSYKWNYPFTSGNETICGLGEKFGQSWLKPIPCNILTSITPKVSSNVLIVAGGYDAEAEDANDPSKPDKATNADSKGRGLYAIYADTGLPFGGFVNSSNLQIPGSIVDVLPYDRTGDGNVDTIYAGDMNGNVYVFWNWIKNATTSTYEDSLSWQMRRIFTGRDTRGNGKGMILKFFQAPDVVMENNYSYSCPGTSPVIKVSTPLDYVFIGSGDREHPKAAQKVSGSTQTNDRLYGIRHLFYDYTACPTAATYPLYDKSSGFYDVTNAFDSASTTFNKDETNLHYGLLTYGSALNWYIVFNDKDDTNNTIYGEKVISQPIVFDGVAYFTTYIPPKAVYKKECGFDCGSHCGDSDGWCKQDKCKPTELGKTRVYAVDYRNGKPVYSKDTAEGFANRDGTEGHRFIKKDRWVAEGIGMSSQPTLIVTKDGPVLLIATSKGVMRINTDEIKKRKKGQKSYWMIK